MKKYLAALLPLALAGCASQAAPLATQEVYNDTALRSIAAEKCVSNNFMTVDVGAKARQYAMADLTMHYSYHQNLLDEAFYKMRESYGLSIDELRELCSTFAMNTVQRFNRIQENNVIQQQSYDSMMNSLREIGKQHTPVYCTSFGNVTTCN